MSPGDAPASDDSPVHSDPAVAPESAVLPESVWDLQLPDIRFGANAVADLPFQLRALGIDGDATGLLVTDSTLVELGHADRIRTLLDDDGFAYDVYDAVERDPDVEAFEACIATVRDERGEDGYDYYVGLGGGSCMDTAKATRAILANGGQVLDYVSEPTGGGNPLHTTGAPLVLIPTTAGTGSEVTAAAAISVDDEGVKDSMVSTHVLASAAILDPTLTTTLPPDLTAETAMDALGHAMEAYTSPRYDQRLRTADPASRPTQVGRTPVSDLLIERSIELIVGSLRRAVNNGEDLGARSDLLEGSLLTRIAGSTVGSNLCHAMSYAVASRYHTHHGETVAALTPAATLGYNVASVPERFATVARLLGVDTSGMSTREAADAARPAFVRFQRDLGVLPDGLNDLAGVTEGDVDSLAKRTIESQRRLLRNNPRRVTEDAIREVFRDALYNDA